MALGRRPKAEKEISYGEIADKFADEQDIGEESSEDASDSESDSEDPEREQEEASSNDENEGDDDDDEEEGEEQEELVAKPAAIRSTVKSSEPCTFDMRNLLALNSHGVNDALLYNSKTVAGEDDRVTIAPTSLSMTVQEDYLLEKATDGCNQLLSVLWQLPVERSDAGPLGTLPKYDELPLPRSLPPPPPKQMTKWEKFAKEKGLPLNKTKRSRKVWDEATNSWKYRHGFDKANDNNEWPIMEVKANQDPFEDPWERARDEKKSKKEHNQESRMKNLERAGVLPKGTAKSVAKQRSSAREVGKAGGNKDRDNVLPAGVPVDLKPSKDGAASNSAKRGKDSTVAALLAVQKSTASLGRFDKMREGEPERKKALTGLKKRKFESDSDKKRLDTESERSMKLLKSVVEGGGVAKERARKKGELARGETGYDYDYDDGLGASSFRKKKGRAGAGKAKKMTKKRIK